MFNRRQLADITNFIEGENRNVLLVEGARQVGKTTIVEAAIKDSPLAVRINLEKDLSALRAIDEAKTFKELELLLKNDYGLKDEPGHLLFIDEAQESEKLGAFIRSFKEDWRHCKVILTGSSMSRIFRDNQRIPVGRYTSILITPLTFGEFLEAFKKDALLEELEGFKKNPLKNKISDLTHQLLLKELDIYLKIGGLPEVINSYIEKIPWAKILTDIFLSQVEDFIRKTEYKNREIFIQALKGVANNLGYSSKYTHLADKLALARNLSSVLNAWKLTYEIEQKGNSTTSTFYPKRYLYDTGIAQYLRQMPFPDISVLPGQTSAQRTPLGGLIENALLLEIISCPGLLSISGWKSGSQGSTELDFVIKTENTLIPVECKASLKLSRKHLYALEAYNQVAGLNKGILVSLAPFEVVSADNRIIYNLPLYSVDLGILEKLVD